MWYERLKTKPRGVFGKVRYFFWRVEDEVVKPKPKKKPKKVKKTKQVKKKTLSPKKKPKWTKKSPK